MNELELTEYLETHFEVVARISYIIDEDFKPSKKVARIYAEFGHGGMYELAKDLTDKFHSKYKDTVWGEELDWIDTMWDFLHRELEMKETENFLF